MCLAGHDFFGSGYGFLRERDDTPLQAHCFLLLSHSLHILDELVYIFTGAWPRRFSANVLNDTSRVMKIFQISYGYVTSFMYTGTVLLVMPPAVGGVHTS